MNENCTAGTDELQNLEDAAAMASEPVATSTKKAKKAKEPKAPKEPKAKKEKAPKEPKPKRDNIARVNGMITIGEVRKALQIAIAKKAKAAGKPDTQARYDIEISAAKTKLADLLESATTLSALVEMGEEPGRIITALIGEKKAAFDKFLADTNTKVSKRVFKEVSDEIPASFLEELPAAIHESLIKRFNQKDYNLRSACKCINFIEATKVGTYLTKNDAWVPAAEVNATAEAPADSTTEA